MRRDLDPKVFIGIIAVLVLAVALWIWRGTGSSFGNDEAEAQFRKTEQWAKEHNIDLRKDPLTAPVYYKYHPEEKPPGGQMPMPVMPGPGMGMNRAGMPGGMMSSPAPAQPPGGH